MSTAGRVQMRPMVFYSFRVPNVPQLTITTVVSGVVPRCIILPFNTKKSPKHNDANRFLYVSKCCNSPPGVQNRLSI